MKEARDYIWIIPLVAGVFTLIAILTPTAICYPRYLIPTACYGNNWDWWMWNFQRRGDNSILLFISGMNFIIPSILTTSVVLLSAINLLIFSIRTKMRTLNTKDFELMSIFSAVVLIGIMIFYVIAMDIANYDRYGYYFWEAYQPGFGIFLPFISAALSLIGVGRSRYYSKRKEDNNPPQMDTI